MDYSAPGLTKGIHTWITKKQTIKRSIHIISTRFVYQDSYLFLVMISFSESFLKNVNQYESASVSLCCYHKPSQPLGTQSIRDGKRVDFQ